MEAPAQIDANRLSDYLDVMSKTVFQSGMSWNVVRQKWDGTRAALSGFDPVALSELTPLDIDRLMTDTRLIRNRKKLEAIAHNAGQMLELEKQYGTFRAYLQSHGDFEATVKDMRKRFKFLGELGAFYFLYVVREPVPPYEEWKASRGK